METKLLNDISVCPKCGFEYLPEYQFHKEDICDNCIEHEIDRVYGERGDPWTDDDDIYIQDCAICHTQYNITDQGATVHCCADCQKVFDTERREWERKYGGV